MVPALKGHYPWRLGATSFVVPAGILENVELLASLVDDVQLLYFESTVNRRLEHAVDITALKDIAGEFQLSYTVHLPSDIRLGDADAAIRRAGIAEVVMLMEELSGLSPLSYDLHLHRDPDCVPERWLGNIEAGLAELAETVAEARHLVAVENIDYPVSAVLPLVSKYGFSFCLDIGHAIRYQHDLAATRAGISQARHIHYHGVRNGRDHGAITGQEEISPAVLGAALSEARFNGVVTLEMYEVKKLQQSMALLKRAWAPFERREHRI